MPTLVKINELSGVSNNKRTFANIASQRLQRIVNTTQFQDKVRKGGFTGRKFCNENGSCSRITDNKRILRFILRGIELGTPADNKIDLMVRLSQLRRRTVGYVTPPNPLITTNTIHFNDWFAERDTLSPAAHWMHEWMHAVGFRHVPFSNGDPDRRDVPYMIGRFVVEVGRTVSLKKEGETDSDGQGYLDLELEHFNDVEGSMPEFETKKPESDDYRILQSVDLQGLQRGVAYSLKKGWKLSGGIATATVGNQDEIDFIYIQAIYR